MDSTNALPHHINTPDMFALTAFGTVRGENTYGIPKLDSSNLDIIMSSKKFTKYDEALFQMDKQEGKEVSQEIENLAATRFNARTNSENRNTTLGKGLHGLGKVTIGAGLASPMVGLISPFALGPVIISILVGGSIMVVGGSMIGDPPVSDEEKTRGTASLDSSRLNRLEGKITILRHAMEKKIDGEESTTQQKAAVVFFEGVVKSYKGHSNAN